MNKSKSQILIVDDEPDIREVLELTLGRMNLETRSASNLEEARHLLTEFEFNLCLTDMRLRTATASNSCVIFRKNIPTCRWRSSPRLATWKRRSQRSRPAPLISSPSLSISTTCVTSCVPPCVWARRRPLKQLTATPSLPALEPERCWANRRPSRKCGP